MNKKVFAAKNNTIYEVKMRLYEIEEYLLAKKFTQFTRISKNSIVNFDFVKKVDMTVKGSIFIVLNDNSKISVSRRYYAKIKCYINTILINMDK